MRFWDSSAVIPLCLAEQATATVRGLLDHDSEMTVWWGTLVECWSAFARLRREGTLDLSGEAAARAVVQGLRESWHEVQPVEEVRQQAGRLMRVHPLRASDALQLGAALVWTGSLGSGVFVTLDQRLRTAAMLEGLVTLPH